MSLPSTGLIKLNDLKQQLGSGPGSVVYMSQYYQDGLGSGLCNIPNRGNLITLGMFRGLSASYITNGLIAFFDPGNSNSYIGSGANIKSLVGSNITGTLAGTFTYSSSNGGSIRLLNNNSDRLSNRSYLTLPMINSISTLSLWYRLNGVFATPSYFLDARDGAANGWMHNEDLGLTWSNAVMRVNGGSNVGLNKTTLTSIFTSNVWRNVTLSPSSPVSDDITMFARYSLDEGVDIAFGQIMMYNRQLSEGENQRNYNFFRSRYGL